MNYNQVAILFSQGALVAFIMFLLFHFRRQLGIGVLFSCMVFFQFIQVFLSSAFTLSITNSFDVSPGSSVFFTATIFTLLIIYIKEGANHIGKTIYGLLVINLVMLIIIQSFKWNLNEVSGNSFNLSTNLFNNSTFDLFVGSVVLFLDSLLIIVIFEFISNQVRFLFLRIFLTMLFVVIFDTLLYSIIAFWNFESLNTIIISGLISRGIFAVFYSVLFYFYLRWFDSSEEETDPFKMKYVFQSMSYKQKFESVAHDIKKVKEERKIEQIISKKEKEKQIDELAFANTKINFQKQALKKEKELSELKTRFISTTSHEFRTPLSVINFSAGSIKKYWSKMEPVMIVEKLTKIENQVLHMTKLLDDVLIVGQAEAGETRNDPLTLNLGKFIGEIIEEVYHSSKKAQKIVLIDCEELKSTDIFIDEKLGRNIFINLISNAVKFSPNAHQVNVELSSENDHTIISVTDFGIGIPKSEVKKIFMPFIRGENVDLIQGTGLGLSIVKEAVDLMGGKIIVNSVVGKGTSFIVKIPTI
jgi:signal transduction histidine kinase